jgi:hypothetical protein
MFEIARRRYVGALAVGIVALAARPAVADPAPEDPEAAEPAAAEPASAAEPPAAEAEPASAEPADAPAQAEPVSTAPAAPAPASSDARAAAPAPAPSAPLSSAAPVSVVRSAARRSASSSETTPWFGVMADIGLPDGATASIVVRPIRAVRAYAGFSHNLISLGERVGVSVVPLSWWASPTLSVEYGHYAEGNANPLVRAATGDATFSSAVLERVGYDYANAHAGLELGRKWFTFYLHAGVSRITGTVHNLSAETMAKGEGTTVVTFPSDPNVRLWTVSARLGFIVYLAK